MTGGSAARLRREALKARTLAQNVSELDSRRLLAIAKTLESEATAIEQALIGSAETGHFDTP